MSREMQQLKTTDIEDEKKLQTKTWSFFYQMTFLFQIYKYIEM